MDRDHEWNWNGGDMKKRDAFDARVEKVQRGQGTTNNRWYLFPEDAAKLLRNQHRRFVKVLKRIEDLAGSGEIQNEKVLIYNLVRTTLAALKGKP